LFSFNKDDEEIGMMLQRSPSPDSGSVTPVDAKFLGACGYASYRPAMAYTDAPSAVGMLRPAAAPRLALAAPQPDRRRALELLANCSGRNAASRLLASPLGTCMALGRQWAMFE